MFNVIISDEVSINDLAVLLKKGESVLRSAHVGNQYVSNMVLLSAGIPAIHYDRTVGKKDKNYYPHLVLQGGRSRLHGVLCNPSVVIARTTAGSDHLSVLQRVIPKDLARIELYSDYIRRHESLGRHIMPLLSRIGQHIGIRGKAWEWRRFVLEDGSVEERNARSWKQIENEGIFGISRETYGWIMPNIFNIILVSLFESLEYKTRVVHHLSGPDMITYIGKLVPDLSVVWDNVADYVGAPKDLDFYLYPTAYAKFATLASRRNQLNDLIMNYELLDSFKENKAVQIKAVSSEERTLVLNRLIKRGNELNYRLKASLGECSDLFVNLSTQRHITHHDAAIDGLYVPSWTLNQPLKRLKAIHKELSRLYLRNYARKEKISA